MSSRNNRATTAAPILVSGGSGRLGRQVVARLQQQGQAVRVLARDTRSEAHAFGPAASGVAWVEADLDDPASLRGVCDGAERLFLLSPIHPRLAAQQQALADEAARAGVQRIVKLSGSDWTLQPPGRTASGDAHLAVEQHLAQLGIAHVALRPNAWMQVALAGALDVLRHGGTLRDPFAGAAVAYIDLRDIADVAVQQLLAPTLSPGPLVLTGPQSLTWADIAGIASQVLGRPVVLAEPVAMALTTPALAEAAALGVLSADALAAAAFTRLVHGQFARLISAGAAAEPNDTVQWLLGRLPRSLAGWLGEALGAGTGVD